jgi:hypothetical protein
MHALGGWQRVADHATSLVDDPLLVPLVSLVTREAAGTGATKTAALRP